MKEDLVSVETARLAQKKGFDWRCDYGYNSYDNQTAHILHDRIRDDYDSFVTNERGSNWDYIDKGYLENLYEMVTAIEQFHDLPMPTQAQLQAWLRKTYGFHIQITWVDTLSDIYVYHISTTGNAIRPDSPFYHSYEKALEAGLQESLRLLIP